MRRFFDCFCLVAFAVIEEKIYYACSNQPRPELNKEYFSMFHVPIKFVMSSECKYDRSATDFRCSVCKFRKGTK